MKARPCKKRRFHNRVEAMIALARIDGQVRRGGGKRGKSGSAPIRAYPCPLCKSWHLTSKP